MSMKIGVNFATTMATPEHIRIAEELGYTHAWCFYSPAIYVDPWMVLALATERTTRIDLGVSVMVPRFRHVADVACSAATLHQLAPDRVTLVVGAGFTSTALLRRKGVPWAVCENFVTQVRSLLAGETIELEGVEVSLLHEETSGLRYPIDIPIWIAAHGPKAIGVASRVGNGMITNPTHGDQKLGFDGPASVQYYGTVLEPGETYDDPAVLERGGPTASLALHMGQFGPLAGSPEQLGFAAEIEKLPAEDQAIATHRTHMLSMSELDRRFMTGDVLRNGSLTGTPEDIRERLDSIEASGATHFFYCPGGPDIPRELEAFMKATSR